jgi:hypothetical protein
VFRNQAFSWKKNVILKRRKDFAGAKFIGSSGRVICGHSIFRTSEKRLNPGLLTSKTLLIVRISSMLISKTLLLVSIRGMLTSDTPLLVSFCGLLISKMLLLVSIRGC